MLSQSPRLDVIAAVESVQDFSRVPLGAEGLDAILFGPPVREDEMEGESSVQTVAHLAACAPVLVVSEFSRPSRVLDTVRAGALGCVTGQVDDDELLRAVDTVVAGGFHLAPTLAPRMHAELREPTGAEPRTLARRELEALRLLAEGLTHSQIGRRMGLTEATVSTYVKRIRTKLNVGNKADLTRTAIELGLLREAGTAPTRAAAPVRGTGRPRSLLLGKE
ncbi:DNA-binding response regulator [Streptomyces sp. NPDC050161]|uniref:DNA-binding response regulator n=1 Tax=Streptomyces sp. NPDC050161 TaxID=3365604 RepID=UPI00379813B9